MKHFPRTAGDTKAHSVRRWLRHVRDALVFEAGASGAALTGVPVIWDSSWMGFNANIQPLVTTGPAVVDTTLKRRRLVREIRLLLSSLGATPKLVAGSLERIGARGETGNPDHSPLAEFLRVVLAGEPGIEKIAVGNNAVRIVRGSRQRPVVTIRFPRPVSIFVLAFEAGFYPELTTQDTPDG